MSVPKRGKVDREDRFIDDYLIHLNATKAYKTAHPDCTDETARTEGSRLLANPDIQKKISDAKLARSKRTRVTQDRVVRELARVAFSDLREFVKWDLEAGVVNTVRLRPSSELSKEKARAVSEISNTANGVKVKLHNKVRALEVLLEHVKMENQKAADSQPVSFVDLIKKAAAEKARK